MRTLLSALLIVASMIVCLPAFAHEYWLSPLKYKSKSKDPIKVDIRNGEAFDGRAYTCIPEKIRSIRLIQGDNIRSINCKHGAFPAIKISDKLNPGFYSLLVETTERRVSYGDWDRFSNFIKSHGQHERLSQYDRAPISERRVKEQFYRYAKTLVQVGETNAKAWQQTEALMHFEIIPLSNPMGTETQPDFKLIYNGKPLPNQQLDVFFKNSDGIEKTTYKTNKKGIANINIGDAGEYLVNSVLLLEPDQSHFDWKTLWTSFTFIR